MKFTAALAPAGRFLDGSDYTIHGEPLMRYVVV
jgi:hypothetical protein